jgi:hypothetical protein
VLCLFIGVVLYCFDCVYVCLFICLCFRTSLFVLFLPMLFRAIGSLSCLCRRASTRPRCSTLRECSNSRNKQQCTCNNEGNVDKRIQQKIVVCLKTNEMVSLCLCALYFGVLCRVVVVVVVVFVVVFVGLVKYFWRKKCKKSAK